MGQDKKENMRVGNIGIPAAKQIPLLFVQPPRARNERERVADENSTCGFWGNVDYGRAENGTKTLLIN